VIPHQVPRHGGVDAVQKAANWDRDEEEFTAPYSGMKYSPPRKEYVKRNRNSPYRRLWQQTEMGFVELNKMDHQRTPDELARIRKGVEAAQALAMEMAQAKEKLLAQGRRTKSKAMGVSAADVQMIRDLVREVLSEKLE
jgi:hypothetical protein